MSGLPASQAVLDHQGAAPARAPPSKGRRGRALPRTRAGEVPHAHGTIRFLGKQVEKEAGVRVLSNFLLEEQKEAITPSVEDVFPAEERVWQ